MNTAKMIKLLPQETLALVLKKWRREQDKMTLKVLQAEIYQHSNIKVTLGYLSRIETVGAIKPSADVFKACLKVYDKDKDMFVEETKTYLQNSLTSDELGAINFLSTSANEDNKINDFISYLHLNSWSKEQMNSGDFIDNIYEGKLLASFRKLDKEDKQQVIQALKYFNPEK